MIPNLHIDSAVLNRDEVLTRLGQTGLLFFDGISTEAVSELAHSLGAVVPHPDASVEGVTFLNFDGRRKLRRSGEKGFSSEELYPHTDRSILARPPSLLILWCERNSPYGGQSVFADGRWLYERLQLRYPADLEELENSENFIFKYNDEMANYAIFERLACGRRRIRFRRDGFLYSTAAAARSLQRLNDLIDNSMMTLTLGPGQGYIVQNTRWLHGRTNFLGRRSFRRILVQSEGDNTELLEGFEQSKPVVSPNQDLPIALEWAP